MKILVLGAGLMGVTSAYLLAQQGHEVTVLDRAADTTSDTSRGNGGLLTPSMSDPWNTPGCWRTLLGSLVRSDSPMQLRLAALPSLADWGIGFLRNSAEHRYERNTRSNLQMALHSLKIMEKIRSGVPISYERAQRGTLRIFRNPEALEHAQARLKSLLPEIPGTTLSVEQLLVLEPALEPIRKELAGGIHYTVDEHGDAYAFCLGLRAEAERLGVRFLSGSDAQIRVRDRQVTSIVAGSQSYSADRYVVACGSYSAKVLAGAGVRIPVQPVKGYSLTFDNSAGKSGLRVPLVDDDYHAVVTPFEKRLRLAGTAEFCGSDLTLRPERIRNLERLLGAVLPSAGFDLSKGVAWCGLRAVSVDGVPLIGETSIRNLFVNTGQGHLGWTMAAGCADLLSDLLSARPPALDPAPYSPRRFG